MLNINTVYCDDCYNLLPQIDDESIDLICIDPPYCVTKQDWDKNDVVTHELSEQLFRVLKPTGSLYVWCGIGEKSQSLIRWFPIFNERWFFKDLITWKKNRGIGMRKGWLYTREEVMWWVKDNKSFVWNVDYQYSEERRSWDGGSDHVKPSQNGKCAKSLYKRWTNVWTDIKEPSYSNIKISHFTPKPLKAVERIVKLHTKKGDLVLDCFGGSGTTGIASKILGCNYILIEKERQFVELAEKRLEETNAPI